ncbi:chalcone isomerase family protein [Bdellovibrio bacteriovorus]|uniref:chalcone isomerase family protein n=1 Tax=Bdellovibrio bacteriovorus TaxID=959 RepID=UPI0021CF0FAD|nr:chalcone isomerase family protein [Bdellovibrio bacteriovorus]UXR63727.1 chalcone isomerase family protein [Bdellovibrio bacteriovorus]
MKHLIAGLATLLLSVHASAALLTPEGSGEKIEKVTLSNTATAQVADESVKLTSVGAGLRAKKVVFVNVKVYVGQLFVSNTESFKKSDAEALGSLKDQQAVAIQLHFLRDVDADNVQKSFKEALKANNISLEDAAVKQFLDSVSQGGEAKDGKALTILGAKLKDGSESIFYETTAGNVSEIKGPAGFIEKVFAIWLGKPSDDGVANLKKSILKK